uniref:adenine phosphoribosyltransferase n=1 Tax=Cyprinus carpio carpio TaxID=630221 RepID=A0A9J8CNV7_CYPCA
MVNRLVWERHGNAHYLNSTPNRLPTVTGVSFQKSNGLSRMDVLAVPQKREEGSAVAITLGKGFLAIRKAGHLCVQTRTQDYSDYSGREKLMEVRVDVLKPGLRVLIVDQWIETGGTMRAAIKLVENQGATVVGIAAVAIENSEGGKWLKENYKYSHCIPNEMQSQIDSQYLESFKNFSG